MLQELDEATKPIQREWIIFMLERVGHNHLPKLLDYYEGIGWISESVARKLLELAKEEKRYRGPAWTLSAQEHGESLIFIERISGKHIENTFHSRQRGKATPDPVDVEKKDEHGEGDLEGNIKEKVKMIQIIERKDVTIKNLEKELEKKDISIRELGEKIRELEQQLDETGKEIKKSMIFRGILQENMKLAKARHRVHEGNGINM
ncbi:Archaeal flagella protein [uncultured archaeon]|nr:Archaeal flagella protein [uncultured archaeon]